MRYRLSLLARSVLVLGLVAAAANPVRNGVNTPVSAVAVVDVSRSVSDDDLQKARRVLVKLWAAAGPPHQLRMVRFAATAAEAVGAWSTLPERRDRGSSAFDLARIVARPASPREDLSTNIAAALELAAGLTDPAVTRRLLLVSDGRATEGDAFAQVNQLARTGIRLDTVTLAGSSTGADFAITGLATATAAAVQPRATFPLLIQLAARTAGQVRLEMTRNGRAIEGDELARTIALGPGTTSVAWNVRLDDDAPTSLFAARARWLQGSDVHPENDRAVLAIARPTPPSALVLATSPDDARSLEAALRAQSIETRIALAGSPAFEAALRPESPALGAADLVVLCDLPRESFGRGASGASGASVDGDSSPGMAALEGYVRGGGGLLVTGGPHTFGPGGWDGSSLEALLPLRLDLPQRRDEPTLAMALIIDRSGSMSGPKMELTKQAAQGTADLLPPEDQIAVVVFDSQATVVVPLQRAANRLRIARDIGRVQPTGGTNILAGLREGLEQLGAARARKKHAILLSDGQSSADGIIELVDGAASAHITISTISVGETADNGLLQLIARHGGGRHYQTRDPASIPHIFTREASEATSSSITELSTRAVPHRRAGPIAGIPFASAPRLRGYVRTRARAQAEVLLSSEAGDPLLSRWTVGLGQVTAWTSDLGPRWAGDWTRWSSFNQLWGQIARTTMRPRAASNFPLSAVVADGFVEASLETTGSGGGADSEASDTSYAGLDASLELTEVRSESEQENERKNERKSPTRIAMSESAPGQYRARFPVNAGADAGGGQAPVALMLKASVKRDGRAVASGSGQISLPPAPELRPLPAPGEPDTRAVDRMAALASLTGGRELTDPADLFRGAAPRRSSRSLRAPLLGSLALLLVVDLALRRLAATSRRRPTRRSPAPHGR